MEEGARLPLHTKRKHRRLAGLGDGGGGGGDGDLPEAGHKEVDGGDAVLAGWALELAALGFDRGAVAVVGHVGGDVEGGASERSAGPVLEQQGEGVVAFLRWGGLAVDQADDQVAARAGLFQSGAVGIGAGLVRAGRRVRVRV